MDPSDEDDRIYVGDDLELLYTLCTVWPDGPYAQQFYAKRKLEIAPLAAREVRRAIEASVIYDCELSLDHVVMLRRIEAMLASQPQGRLSVGSRFLLAVLAKVRPAIQTIRAALPLRLRPGLEVEPLRVGRTPRNGSYER